MRLSSILAGIALALPSVMVQAQRVVGYYGKTAGECPDYPSFAPAQLPYELYTHLNFAFVMINDDGVVEMQHPEDEALYKELNDLKTKKPSLRTAVAGTWTWHTTPKWSLHQPIAKSSIKSAMDYVRKYNFDGIDFDWEYPSDKLCGGHDNDPENFVDFLREFREAADAENLKAGQERLILSIALPGGPFHGQYFTIPDLAKYVDWFNIMAYNLHGQWEDMVFCAAPLYDTAAKTKYNGYSVGDAVKSMAPTSVSPKQFNLGLSLSGVTFTLKDKSKTTPGSPAVGPGKEGCQEKGAMAYFEAKKLNNNFQVASAKARTLDHFDREVTQEPRMDEVGKCMYMTSEWVGYDTAETFKLKIDYLKKVGFGGVSIWSMDSDSANHELTTSIHESLTQDFIQSESVGNNKTKGSINVLQGQDTKSRDEKMQMNAGFREQIGGLAAKMMALVALSMVLLA
ncbi:hypothetical protein BGX26_011224 [Mortierella sp. AD094]|nr:hypothetical protein BGX26_011224 [Mortierella sp. AD094]